MEHKYKSRKGAYLSSVCKHGHDHGGGSYRSRNGTCLECADIRIKRWSATDKGKQSRKATKQKYKTSAASKDKEYRKKNKDRILEYNKLYRANNYRWYQEYYAAYNSRRRAAKLRAIPKWADFEYIEDVYNQTRVLSNLFKTEFQVDHIIPLVSDFVCVDYTVRLTCRYFLAPRTPAKATAGGLTCGSHFRY